MTFLQLRLLLMLHSNTRSLLVYSNPAVTSSLFIGVAATGPVLGVFCGGWAVDKLGGYRGYECRNRTMKLCCCLGLASCVFGFPSVFVTNLYLFAGLLWLMLFFGGAVLPGCTGVAVSVIPRQVSQFWRFTSSFVPPPQRTTTTRTALRTPLTTHEYSF